jgi:protein phosphatase methylesterase 1
MNACRLRDKDKHPVPVPAKMYTKPADISAPHSFGGKKLGVSYDPLPWSDFFDRKEKLGGKIPMYIAGDKGHVFLCMHGAGHSALSFAALAKELKTAEYTVVAFDFRGHGDHYCENETDMSEATLINDAILIFEQVSALFHDRSIILVGHSMGGSIATKTASKILGDFKAKPWSR